jgi:hypothetical protein
VEFLFRVRMGARSTTVATEPLIAPAVRAE